MKKSILSVIVALFASFTLFAADIYTVKNVTGKVQYQENGVSKTVKKGMELSSDVVISVGKGANLNLTKDGKDLKIKSGSNGTIESFAATSGGIKLGDSAEKNTTAKAKNAGDKGVDTASSRASDVKKEMQFADDSEEDPAEAEVLQ